MTNNERIAVNNTRLSALVETAESLPDAVAGGGGGSSSGSLDACTVILAPIEGLGYFDPTPILANIWCTRVINGVVTPYETSGSTSTEITNILCGSAIAVRVSCEADVGVTVTEGGAEIISHNYDEDCSGWFNTVIKAPTTKDDFSIVEFSASGIGGGAN